MSRKLAVLVALVGALGLASAPVRAHGNTQFGGPAVGTLSTVSPTFTFAGDAVFAGRVSGAASAAEYGCVASGPNYGITPYGGPFEGMFTCVANVASGGAPTLATGTFKGWSNTLSVVMQGVFDPGTHRLNCEGALIPIVRTDQSITFAVELNCLVE